MSVDIHKYHMFRNDKKYKEKMAAEKSQISPKSTAPQFLFWFLKEKVIHF